MSRRDLYKRCRAALEAWCRAQGITDLEPGTLADGPNANLNAMMTDLEIWSEHLEETPLELQLAARAKDVPGFGIFAVLDGALFWLGGDHWCDVTVAGDTPEECEAFCKTINEAFGTTFRPEQFPGR